MLKTTDTTETTETEPFVAKIQSSVLWACPAYHLRRHRMNGIVPGQYLALAWEQVEKGTAKNQVSFKGAFQVNDTVSPGPSPTTALLSTTGTEKGTLPGQSSFTQELTLNGANLTDAESAQSIAANGDSIYTTVVGSVIPADVVFTMKEIHIITSGTGRFSGAQRSFTVHRTHVVEPSDDGTHVTCGWFEGTIISPGATH